MRAGARRGRVDTLWVLMDPAVFDRLVHRLGAGARTATSTWFARTDLPAAVRTDPTPEAPP